MIRLTDPQGQLQPVKGTPFDFRRARCIATAIRNVRDEQIRFGRGCGRNFALEKGATATPQPAARLEDPASSRVLEMLRTEPRLQADTGNFVYGTLTGKGGHSYRHVMIYRLSTARRQESAP